MYTVHTLAASPLPLPPSRLFELGVERHLGNALERARHGAAGLRLLGRPLKGGLVESGHLASHLELHARDRGRPAHHLQRSEEHTSELQSLAYLVCRLLLEKKKKN